MTPLKSADPDSADDRFRSYASLQIIIARWKIIVTALFREKTLFDRIGYRMLRAKGGGGCRRVERSTTNKSAWLNRRIEES